ncbi:MAG: hypothetical protein KatS3mg060_0175 [Dehalococcoidia bacterium]|nr:MAG: hypothetical protein KatS3mg060_0175 [Dehalococcoidia bacterium]
MRGRWRARAAIVLVLTLLGLVIAGIAPSGAAPPAGPRDSVAVTRNIRYGEAPTAAGMKALLADLYQPSGGSVSRPAVILVHGGGFVQGDKTNPQWVQHCRSLATRGYVCLSINYRLEGDRPVIAGATARARAVAAAAEDAATAVRWLQHEAATLGVDPSRIAIGGGSAGAIAALLAAYSEGGPRVAAVVSLWGSMLGRTDLIGPGAPPVLLIHGVDDPTVPLAASEAIAARAEEVGVRYAFYAVPGVGHGMSPRHLVDGRPLSTLIADVLDEWLRPGEAGGA